MHACMHAYVCMHMYACTCMHAHIYTQCHAHDVTHKLTTTTQRQMVNYSKDELQVQVIENTLNFPYLFSQLCNRSVKH